MEEHVVKKGRVMGIRQIFMREKMYPKFIDILKHVSNNFVEENCVGISSLSNPKQASQLC